MLSVPCVFAIGLAQDRGRDLRSSEERAALIPSVDRANLRRGGQNVHYNRLLRNLSMVQIPAEKLLYDDGVADLSSARAFDWMTIYGEASGGTPMLQEGEYISAGGPPSNHRPPCTTDEFVLGVAQRIAAGNARVASEYCRQYGQLFSSEPLIQHLEQLLGSIAEARDRCGPA